MSQPDSKQIRIEITNDGYRIKVGNLSGFELLGALEQIVYDLKHNDSQKRNGEASGGTTGGDANETDEAGKGDGEIASAAGIVPETKPKLTSKPVLETVTELVSEPGRNEPLTASGGDQTPPPANAAPRLQETVARLKTGSAAPPAESSAATDLRTRIGNAVKAIRDLGGRVETPDLSKMTDDDLQTELEELTAQYKRLKNSKGK